ncbi:hypothetical protein V8C42DRAFT_315751 [Trichoderma barbatum]
MRRDSVPSASMRYRYLLTRDCLNLVPGASSWVSVLIRTFPQAVERRCEGTGVKALRLLKRPGKTM